MVARAELAVRAAPVPKKKSAAAGDTDNLRHLVNLWEQMQICPLLLDPAGDYEAQDQLNYLDTLDDQIELILDIVARGVVKGCIESGRDPAKTIAIFRIPGAWEEEGFKILKKYGVPVPNGRVAFTVTRK